MLKAVKSNLLIDGTGAEPIRNAVVLIEDDKILKVGPQSSIEVPESAEVTDVGDQTLLPGFVDPHSHATIWAGKGQPGQQKLLAPGLQVLKAAAYLRVDLLAGTTTMRILGENNNADFLLRQAINDGTIPGPRLFVSGKAVRPSHGHGHMGTPADGIDAIRAMIRENCQAGADLIKMFVSGGISDHHTELDRCYYSREEIGAAVEEASRSGKKVAIHCKGGIGLRWSVEAGVSSVEHGYLATDDDLELMKKKGAWLGATLVNLYHPQGNAPAIMNDPICGPKAQYARAKMEEIFPKVVKGGVRWNLSTDSRHGTLPYAMETAVRMGASNMQAIQAVTGWAAESCGLEEEVGTLQAGRYADMIAVEGNPLDDIKAAYRVKLIMKGGKRLEHISTL